ncbi:MAG: hypothetical protein Q8909_05100 [Bacteroidota bacterium]|nr:hypothetical protein [Bacteroidota bacterium]
MKTRLFLLLLFPSLLFFSLRVNAQDDITNIFKAGGDVSKLLDGYMAPAGTAFATGLGSNWYNTAATHKTLGFDLTASVGIIQTPSSAQTFSFSNLEYLTPTSGTMPTFVGKEKNGQTFTSTQTINGKPVVTLNTPGGVSNILPAVNLQFTIGLPKGNDVSFRYTPELNYNGFSGKLWGAGLKHDVKQWIPGVKLLPFDASVMVGYTKLDLNYKFPESAVITPEKLVDDPAYLADGVRDDLGYSRQGFGISASALMANLIISKKLMFFTPYIGMGITKTDYKISLNGVYPIYKGLNSSNKVEWENRDNPFNLTKQETMPGLTAGFRLKMLAVLAINAQYTLQKYSVASVGIGINFR